MNNNSDDFPLGVLASGMRSSIGRAMMIIGGGGFVLVLIALGVFAWGRLAPSKVGVEVFNRWYGTNLSTRQICFEERGFVDSEFYVSIPMTQQEFATTTKAIGMQISSSKRRHLAHNGPWWFDEPETDVFIFDRIGEGIHRDYIDGHYDSKGSRGYFHYFDH